MRTFLKTEKMSVSMDGVGRYQYKKLMETPMFSTVTIVARNVKYALA